MTAASGRPHVVVTGLMGVGKSTVAGTLATALGRQHRDSDDDLRLLFGATGAELAASHGVDTLHELESAVLLGALADERPLVISAAAWVVEDPWCRQAMAARAVVVVLWAPVEELAGRIVTGTHRRPIDRAGLAELAERRRPLFASVADITADATQSAHQVVEQLLDQLAAFEA